MCSSHSAQCSSRIKCSGGTFAVCSSVSSFHWNSPYLCDQWHFEVTWPKAICPPVLLNLSTAFDTVDHKLLLECLATSLSLQDKALGWVPFYLLDCTQFVSFAGVKSFRYLLGMSPRDQACILSFLLSTPCPWGTLSENMAWHFISTPVILNCI